MRKHLMIILKLIYREQKSFLVLLGILNVCKKFLPTTANICILYL